MSMEYEGVSRTRLGVPKGQTATPGAYVMWEFADGDTQDRCEVSTLEAALKEIEFRVKENLGKLNWIQIDFNPL